MTPAVATTTPTPSITHGLVRFGRLYGIYYIPQRIRHSVQLGELVLVESAQGTNTGTLIADYSAQVADIRKNHAQHPYLSFLLRRESDDATTVEQMLDDVLYPEDRAGSDGFHVSPLSTPPHESRAAMKTVQGEGAVAEADTRGSGASSSALKDTAGSASQLRFELYAKPPVSGLPEHDNWLQRLPRVLRRGVNKDKKKVYFAHKRNNEALHLVNKMILEKHWGGFLSVDSVSYQVDFLSTTVFLHGGEHLHGQRNATYTMCGPTPLDRSGTVTASALQDAKTMPSLSWGPQDYASAGAMLSTPLRTGIVEFRFVHQYPEFAHLTRSLIGNYYNYKCEAEIQLYDRALSASRGASGISLEARTGEDNSTSSISGLSRGGAELGSKAVHSPNPSSTKQYPPPLSQPILCRAMDAGTFLSQPPLQQPTPSAVCPPSLPLQALMPAMLATASPGGAGGEYSFTTTTSPSFSQCYSLASDGSATWLSQQQQQQLHFARPVSVMASSKGFQPPPTSAPLQLTGFYSVGTVPSPMVAVSQAPEHFRSPAPPQPQQQPPPPPPPQLYNFAAIPPQQLPAKPQTFQFHDVQGQAVAFQPQQPTPTYYYLHNQQDPGGSSINSSASNSHGNVFRLNIPLPQPQPDVPKPPSQSSIFYMLTESQPGAQAPQTAAGGNTAAGEKASSVQGQVGGQQSVEYPFQAFSAFQNY